MIRPTAAWRRAEAPSRGRLEPLLQAASLPLLLFLILPIAALLLRTSYGDVAAALMQPEALLAVGLSLGTTFTTVILTVLLGIPFAYALAKGYLPWPRLIDTLIDLPTVLPPAVAGVAMLVAFGRRGLLGGALEAANIHIAFTTAAVIMAQMFVAAPFFLKSAILGFSQIDEELEQAAGLDGANRWQTFRYIIAPLSRNSLVGGAVMTWARALGEFGATIIFAGNFPGRTQTMPLAIYIGFEVDLDLALALSVILVAFSFLSLAIIKALLSR